MKRVRKALSGGALILAMNGPFGLASARADEAMIEGCLKAAAELHQVPAGVLVLLLGVEDGRLGEVSQNTNGTVDIGPMQVNDTWVPKIAGHWRASHDAAYRALLNEAGRQILVEDGPRQDLVPIPFDAAAAEDGLLPVFLVAGEAIWRDVTGRGFELKLKRDLGALLSWRIEAIEAETFSCVLLSVMEAIAQVAGPEGVMVLDLARVFDEATARTEARRALA